MKELKLITNILYICTLIVGLFLTIFIAGLLPIFYYFDEIEQVWAVKFVEIMVFFK